jgi:kumamolisin
MDTHGRFSFGGAWLPFSQRIAAIVLLAILATGFSLACSAATSPESGPQSDWVRLPGHVLGALERATPVAASPAAASEPVTLTITLKREDQAGFDRYLHDVYDEHSPRFRHFLSQSQITTRFGPTKKTYDQVLAYLKQNGFTLTQGSTNRLTLTVSGTRAQAERAFSVAIREYELGSRGFFANDRDPLVPATISRDVQAIAGLNNAGAPTAPLNQPVPVLNDACDLLAGFSLVSIPGVVFMLIAEGATFGGVLVEGLGFLLLPFLVEGGGLILTVGSVVSTYCFYYMIGHSISHSISGKPNVAVRGKAPAPPGSQKIGLLEFDTFHASDVQDWLALAGADPSIASRLSQVAVNGGVASPGAGESEVLLDIATVMGLDQSQSTSYVVYHAPANTSWQQMFNAMINGGVTVVSNSWSDCEDQHTLADVQSIDAVLATAAASGISVFNGSGDTGAKCLDGSPNTVGVPASSPHATAVGGTTPLPAQGIAYGGENWWDGSAKAPPTGQGGFGVSRYFARPAYQNGMSASAMRSVPDVVIVADPRYGLGLCQADAGGCPDGLMHGGTSMAAPGMAIMMANLNEILGANLGEVNPIIYPLAATNAFHSPASMGTDFAHVGLGSPRLSYLRLLLSNQTIGPVDPTLSLVTSSRFGVADGATVGLVQANLLDANGYPVSGKSVTLVPSAGSHVVISSPNGPSDLDSGAVVFQVTDTAIEDVTFTVTDATDDVTLSQVAKVSFVAPPATAGGINAAPTTVASDGVSTTTITVTLQDAKGNGTPGKEVTLSQGNGHSIITAPSPAVTDASGQIQFSASDNVSETVTYMAVDLTDGNLPVPGSSSVTFTGGSTSCLPPPPTAANGFTLTPFVNGFLAQNFFFGGISFTGCPGASNPVFDHSGSVLVTDFPTGDLYEVGATGGAVSSADKLSNLGKTFGSLVFGTDGSLYGTTFSPANIVQVDPDTGTVVRIVASGFACPYGLAVDPLSGDLFFVNNCVGGIQNASLWRIQNPSSASPTVVVYSTLPGFGNGQIAFSPDGTLYAVCCAFNNANAPVLQISGTNTPAPHNPVAVPGITADTGGLAMGEVQANGSAKSLIVNTGGASGGAGGSLKLIDIATLSATVLANGLAEPGVIGPDGCMYVNAHDTILKLAPTSGPCTFTPTNPAPALSLSPASVSPNPAQGTNVMFTAALHNVSQPEGTPITFFVGGANSVVKMVRADSNGQATFSYSGLYTGTDQLMAIAQLDSGSPSSNTAQVTWDAGRHMTFLGLNTSPTAGSVGQPATVTASLTDISSTPPVPIANANVTFTLGKSACPAVTDANGLASCMVIPASGGLLSLNATFQGTPNYVGSTTSAGFNARGQAGPPPAPKCPLTQTYWRTHSPTWPVTSLMLGTQLYSEAELLTILNLPTPKGKKKGDASVLLGRELITAKLSIANGSDPTPVTAIIADADNLLSGFNGKLPYGVLSSSGVGKAMLHDEAVLVSFENGALTPKCSRTR